MAAAAAVVQMHSNMNDDRRSHCSNRWRMDHDHAMRVDDVVVAAAVVVVDIVSLLRDDHRNSDPNSDKTRDGDSIDRVVSSNDFCVF